MVRASANYIVNCLCLSELVIPVMSVEIYSQDRCTVWALISLV